MIFFCLFNTLYIVWVTYVHCIKYIAWFYLNEHILIRWCCVSEGNMSLCAGAATLLSLLLKNVVTTYCKYNLSMPYCRNDKLLRHYCSTFRGIVWKVLKYQFWRKMEAYDTSGRTSYSSGQLSHQLHLADCEPALWITELGTCLWALSKID